MDQQQVPDGDAGREVRVQRVDGPTSYTTLRLYEGGERAGDVYVVFLGEQLVVGQVNVYRTSVTGDDWDEHVRRVDAGLLAKVVELAEQCRASVAVMMPGQAESVRTLARAGFEPAGAVWWRPPPARKGLPR